MTITFTIHYHTNWGQVLMLSGSLPELGGWDESQAVYLKNKGGALWEFTINLTRTLDSPLEYKYILKDENSGVTFHEWGEKRTFNVFDKTVSQVAVQDSWRLATKDENALFTSAFTQAIFRRKESTNPTKRLKARKTEKVVRFELLNTRVEANHAVAIVGEPKELGGWDFGKYTLMSDANFPYWTTELHIPNNIDSFSYKYCIVDKATGKLVLDEKENRHRTLSTGEDGVAINDDFFNYPRLPWKGTGVAIPVFSLRSKEGLGVGEFLDIKLLVDWAKRTGMKMIQILPINDTVALHNWADSYPYAAISVFALHPIYLRLEAIGQISSAITNEIVAERKQMLNAKAQVDYEAVMRVKSRYIKQIFDEKKDEFLNSSQFKNFYQENKSWLRPYAAFSYLRDLFGTPKFDTWGRFAKFTDAHLDELTDFSASHFDDIAIHYFQQYHLHIQLLDAAEYARMNNIVLKGDIPIGIYRNSVDAWVAPELYNMKSQAGAPPDDFAEQGQNWRFPTYNWGEMAKDGFGWWRKRLQKMASYFDAYRIDHILGFFRIWEIPDEQRQGIMGAFNPAWAIHKNELYDKGIPFDYLRFCRPFIREHMLGSLFGELTEFVKNTFLVEYQPHCYYLKPEVENQKKVDAYFKLGPDASAEEKAKNEKLKTGLNYLISEVLFFEAPFSEGEAFHPRHSMFKTWSFQEFDGDTQRKLMELYNEYFYRRNENFWREQAMVKLPAIKEATNMLVCGEDLGMVPECVPTVMKDLGILSLEVQRMPKNPKIEFGHPANYPYLSVATPSSHDTSTIRGWWEEDSSRSQRFFNTILGHNGGSPYFCDPWLVREVVVQHIYSPSMWAVFPIQDLVGMNEKLRLQDARAERINEPANPMHYWRYRFHIPMEDLLEESEFNDSLLHMVKEAGRYSAY